MATGDPPPFWLRHPALMPIAVCLSVALVAASVAVVLARGGVVMPHNTANGADLSANRTLVAYVVGAVVHPGVFRLPMTARVQDLVQAAGGSQPQADLIRVNLAAPLFDGEEVFIPLINQPFPTSIGDGGIRVNLNLATATTLRLQLGVSSKTADAIIAYRQQHGSFTSVAQLLLVPISRTIYDRIKNLVTV